MSNHRIFRCAISVILVLSMLISVCPMPAYAQEEVISVSFLIEKEAYSVDMKFEGDQLYCRADQWAEAAGCLWVFNSEQQKVLFYYEGPTILVFYNNETYIKDGENLWVPFFDVATQTGVCFSEVSGNTIRGYRVTPLAVIYKDMDRMFNISQYRISEMLLELDEKWVLLDSAARAYAILSSFSLKGFLDAVSGKMDQDMYDAILLDMLRTDETLLGAITGAGEEIERSGKIINLLQKSLDEDGALVELLEQMDFSESDIREIVWDLSQEAYGNKTLNDLSDLYEANNTTHFLEMLKFIDDMTVSLEADIHSVMAMQEVFLNSDNVYMRQAAQKAIGARVGNKPLTAGMYSLEFLGDVFLDQTVDKLDDLCKDAAGTTSLSELGGRAFVWALDKALSLTETTDAIMYSDVYSLVQLELVNYYYRHRNDTASGKGLMMHSVALLYLRACLASWKMYEFDEALSQSIDNATSMITAEITNLMRYTEEELLQNGTKKETEQTIIDFVKLLPDLLSQEECFLEYLQNHPEYNYYAFQDINGDGVIEMLATEKLDDRNGVFLSTGEYVDLYISKDDVITLAYENIRSKYTYLAYDAVNQRIVSSIGGSGGAGVSYVFLDDLLMAHETSFEAYCHRIDENGEEVWERYYNGDVVSEATQRKYDELYDSWKKSSSEVIVFQAVPKAALIGKWRIYPTGIPHEKGYWVDVVINELCLDADGRASVALGVVVGEWYEGYSGTWSAVPESENEFTLQLKLKGGMMYYSDEGENEQKECEILLQVKLDGNQLLLEKISGDDICLYYSEVYERDLEYETWIERQGPVENHITYQTLLWQYPEYAEYTLHDIDKDGQDELIIREEGSHYIYTMIGNKVKACGEFYSHYSPYCLYAYDGNGVIVHDGGIGSLHLEYVALYSLSDGLLTEGQRLIDTEWHTLDELQSYLSQYTLIDNFVSVVDETLLEEQ